MNTAWLDWFVLTQKTAAMQRLSDWVRYGYHAYVCGQIPAAKAGYLAAKFDSLYGVGLNRWEQSRKREKGLASFKLLMLHQVQHQGELASIHWWLLKTPGEGPEVSGREKWRDPLTQRIEFTGYELVRQTKPGTKKPAWTWRYVKTREQDLRNDLLRAIRNRRDDELRQLIQTIWRTPGFAAARDQVKDMRALILAEFQRSRSGDPLPDIPARPGYVQRLPDKGRPLSELGLRPIKKTVREKRAAPGEAAHGSSQVSG